MVCLVAVPSSFHIPFVSSKYQSDIVAGAAACIADGIGIVMIAVLPVANCNFCPPASFISTDSIPNDRKILSLLAALIPRKSPGIYSLKFVSAGFK